MWIRLIEVHVDPEHVGAFGKIYNEQILPGLKAYDTHSTPQISFFPVFFNHIINFAFIRSLG